MPGPSSGANPIARWNPTETWLPGQVTAVDPPRAAARDVLEEPLVQRAAEAARAAGSGSSPIMWT